MEVSRFLKFPLRALDHGSILECWPELVTQHLGLGHPASTSPLLPSLTRPASRLSLLALLLLTHGFTTWMQAAQEAAVHSMELG